MFCSICLHVYIILGPRDHHTFSSFWLGGRRLAWHFSHIFSNLKHVSIINLGVFEASSTKGLTTPTKHKKKMPFTKRSKKAAIFYRSGSSTKRPWAVEIPPPMIPIVWSLWMGKARKSWTQRNSFYGSLFLIWFEHIWVFPKIMVPQNGWFIRANPIKMDDLGVPLFSETPIFEIHW